MKYLYTLLGTVLTFSLALGQQTDKVKLFEVFTSSTCGPCKPGNEAIDPILEEHINEVAIVKYQMSWPGNGDPYYTDEGGQRRSAYAVNSVPSLFVSGEEYPNTVGAFTTADYENYDAQNQTTHVEIDLSKSINGQTVMVDYTIRFLQEDTDPAFRVFTAIVEKKTTQNIRTNGETEFHYVMKKMLPGGSGEFILETDGFPADTSWSKSLEYTFEGNYNPNVTASNPVDHQVEHTVEEFEDLEVVVWIQNIQTQEVVQSAASWITGGETSTAERTAANPTLHLFPNPATNSVRVNWQANEQGEVRLFNLLGEQVHQANAFGNMQIPISDFEPGIYFVKLSTQRGESLQKLIVR